MTYRLQNLRTHRPALIPEGTWSLGREEPVDIPLHEPSVSAFHATLINRNDGLWIEDAQSTNGTRVQGELISDWTLLQAGHVVMFGDVAFLLQHEVLGDDLAPEPVLEQPVATLPAKTVAAQAVRTVKLPVVSIEEAKKEVQRLVENSENQIIERQQQLNQLHAEMGSTLGHEPSVNRFSDTDRFDLPTPSHPRIKVPSPPRVIPSREALRQSETDNIPAPVPRVSMKPRAVAVAVAKSNADTDAVAVGQPRVRPLVRAAAVTTPKLKPQVIARATPPPATPAPVIEPGFAWGIWAMGLGVGLCLGAAGTYLWLHGLP